MSALSALTPTLLTRGIKRVAYPALHRTGLPSLNTLTKPTIAVAPYIRSEALVTSIDLQDVGQSAI